MDSDGIYRRIGEFVVAFQYVENQIRQIGQLILDPGRSTWPPKALQRESSKQLAAKVAKLYEDNIHSSNLRPEHEKKLREEFRNLIKRFQQLRDARNRFIHSAYIELKAGGEILALMRSNFSRVVETDNISEHSDQEFMSPNSFQTEMEEMGDLAWRLGLHYLQLIHRLGVSIRRK